MNGAENEWDTPEAWGILYEDWHKADDEMLLTALKEEGFSLAFLPSGGPPANVNLDFSIFLPDHDGSPNLVVAAHHLSLAIVDETINRLPHRQFTDGTSIQVLESRWPGADNLFRFSTLTLRISGAAGVPAYAPPEILLGRWAHYARLNIRKEHSETQLGVLHIGLGPGHDPVHLNFLAPHGLVPKRLLL
jgi:hypothetical protein